MVSVYASERAYAFLFEDGDIYASQGNAWSGCVGDTPEGVGNYICLPTSETGEANPAKEIVGVANGFCEGMTIYITRAAIVI